MGLFSLPKYFKITCKFGHVGRNKYLPITVVVKGLNKKDASAKAKRLGGVKRNHPDWCLDGPEEISKEEYFTLKEEIRQDPYWSKKTRQNLTFFNARLVDEPNYTNIRGIKTNTVTFKKVTPEDVKRYRNKKRKIIEEYYLLDDLD